MSDLLINSIGTPGLEPGKLTERPDSPLDGTTFSEALGNAIQEVNNLQAQATEEAEKVMTGGVTDIHTAMIAVQKADISFQMMMQVRNKLVSAYQEIMKMQV